MSPDPAISADLQPYVAAHARLAAQLPGGEVWRVRRAQALERFLSAGWPTSRDESWKYTPHRLIEKRAFEAGSTDAQPLPADVLGARCFTVDGALRLVFVNGRFMPGLSDRLPPGSGLQFASLAQRLGEAPAELAQRLALPGSDAEDRAALLNMAFLADGADLRVAGAVATPIYLVFLTAGAHRAAYPRVLLRVEAESSAVVIEHHVALNDGEVSSNAATSIELERHARLEHLLVSEGNAQSLALHRLQAIQARDSELRQHRLLFGGLLNRTSLQCRLLGEQAAVEANSALIAAERQHLEAHGVLEHAARNTRSEERFRAVASARGRCVFDGRIVVQPSAPRSESRQSSRGLLLSAQAEIDSRPQLEILTDDVKCAHGATTGRLDPNQLFYLLSRGIDAETARALLVYAFLDDVVARLSLEPLRRQLERRVSRALPGSQQLEEFL